MSGIITSPAETLPILYQDESLIAVHKPSGLLVHRSEIDRHETRFVLQIVSAQIGQRVYPVHRLDKPTSGVLLLALSQTSARRLSECFEQGRVSKRYLAVVRGFAEEYGMIDYPLKEELDKMTDARVRKDKPAQLAVTHYRRLAQVELPFAVGRYATSRYSLLELEPKTGRKHQIRRHLKHIYHPIIGDTTHGEGRHNRFFRDHFGCQRLLLAATHLTFEHPERLERITVTAPLAGQFAAVLNALGWHDDPGGAQL